MSFSAVNGSADVKPILSMPRDDAASTISCRSLLKSAGVPAAMVVGTAIRHTSLLRLEFRGHREWP
ncbi:hypothetical protein [Paenibacillus marchantiophytorum]|uniref:hypothetical protein n=1 Tax=Paenibacillus marchantiophytorum TaxID=1619310 RepID=UPI001E34F75C|nr:hypothetical protein [Paenibacillus marchantiophytorum]